MSKIIGHPLLVGICIKNSYSEAVHCLKNAADIAEREGIIGEYYRILL